MRQTSAGLVDQGRAGRGEDGSRIPVESLDTGSQESGRQEVVVRRPFEVRRLAHPRQQVEVGGGAESLRLADVPDTPVRARSAERRVGQEWVSTCRSRWWRYHSKKKR